VKSKNDRPGGIGAGVLAVGADFGVEWLIRDCELIKHEDVKRTSLSLPPEDVQALFCDEASKNPALWRFVWRTIKALEKFIEHAKKESHPSTGKAAARKEGGDSPLSKAS